MPEALRPSAADVLDAWAARVRADREQVNQFREAAPADFYAPIAGMFRVDPRHVGRQPADEAPAAKLDPDANRARNVGRDEPMLEHLRALVQPDDVVLDIGAGGGRYALPLALACREVIAIEPSDGMRHVLTASLAEHRIHNVSVVDDRWPPQLGAGLQGDVALIAHLGYDVEDIGPFLDAMESAARRQCVAVLLSQPPPTEADRLWPEVHGVTRAALPSLPEFLTLLLARGRLFEVALFDRSPQTYAEPEQALTWLRQQLWTSPGSDKDQRLARLTQGRLQERDGRYALSWQSVPVGVVTWHS